MKGFMPILPFARLNPVYVQKIQYLRDLALSGTEVKGYRVCRMPSVRAVKSSSQNACDKPDDFSQYDLPSIDTYE